MSRKQPSNGRVAHPAGISSERGLKPRKKDFLKRRKLKKKGLLHLLDEEPEEDLEAELLQDRHKPKFGEQADAPLKVMLLRDTQHTGRWLQIPRVPLYTVVLHAKDLLSSWQLLQSKVLSIGKNDLDTLYCKRL